MFSPSAELPVASWAPGPRPRVTGGDWRQDCVQVTLALGGGGGAGPTCGSAPPGLSCFLNRACVRLSVCLPAPTTVSSGWCLSGPPPKCVSQHVLYLSDSRQGLLGLRTPSLSRMTRQCCSCSRLTQDGRACCVPGSGLPATRPPPGLPAASAPPPPLHSGAFPAAPLVAPGSAPT